MSVFFKCILRFIVRMPMFLYLCALEMQLAWIIKNEMLLTNKSISIIFDKAENHLEKI